MSTFRHGVMCACDVCEAGRDLDPLQDDREGKQITRAAEAADPEGEPPC